MKIHSMPQGSAEWLAVRLGRITASEADSLVSPLGKIRTGDGPRTFLFKKVCEKFLGYQQDAGSTFLMDQGKIGEEIGIPWYSFNFDRQVTKVGFIETDDSRCGCSPDAICGTDGGVELKAPSAPVHLRYLTDGVIPSEHILQVQFCLWVTQRKWWDFVSFSRVMPCLVVRAEPDAKIQTAISDAVKDFSEKFDMIYGKLASLRDAENAAKTAAYYKSEGIEPPK